MTSHKALYNPSPFWFLFVLTASAILAAVLIAESAQETQAATVASSAVTYSHGILHATIPYRAPHPGSGQLAVEILSPEDEVLGRSERHVDVADGPGTWQEDLKLARELAIDDLVWHRLRYRFAYTDAKDAAIEAAESISGILRMPCRVALHPVSAPVAAKNPSA